MRKAVMVLLACLLAFFAVVSLRAYKATPFCYTLQAREGDDSDIYWISPFITNGNRVTHICAHLYRSDTKPEDWAVELPLDGPTIVSYPMRHDDAMHLIGKFCHAGF